VSEGLIFVEPDRDFYSTEIAEGDIISIPVGGEEAIAEIFYRVKESRMFKTGNVRGWRIRVEKIPSSTGKLLPHTVLSPWNVRKFNTGKEFDD